MSTTRKYTIETIEGTYTVYGETIRMGEVTLLEIVRDGQIVAMFRSWRNVTVEDDRVSRVLDALGGDPA